jgi:hypothetical protein
MRVVRAGIGLSLVVLGGLAACGDSQGPAGAADEKLPPDPGPLRYRADVEPVTKVEDALPSVFVPPFEDCRDPLPGETGSGPDGKVCTHVLIAGCTEPGKYFPEYASCEVVRTQRPFWDADPANESDPNDPRLADSAFMGELAWAQEQIEACGCACCHDSRAFGGKFAQWDIAHGPIWLDTLSDNGVALFAGLADSSLLGSYPASENHGFDRRATGIPTTDTARMQALLYGELERRGIPRSKAEAVPRFGGPLVVLAETKAGACKPGEGISNAGVVKWLGEEQARYIYLLEAGTGTPGVPPNLDTPEGTLWRLDVLADQPALASGSLRYGTSPTGSFQSLPVRGPAPELLVGKNYHLVVLQDPGLPIANCEFKWGAGG